MLRMKNQSEITFDFSIENFCSPIKELLGEKK